MSWTDGEYVRLSIFSPIDIYYRYISMINEIHNTWVFESTIDSTSSVYSFISTISHENARITTEVTGRIVDNSTTHWTALYMRSQFRSTFTNIYTSIDYQGHQFGSIFNWTLSYNKNLNIYARDQFTNHSFITTHPMYTKFNSSLCDRIHFSNNPIITRIPVYMTVGESPYVYSTFNSTYFNSRTTYTGSYSSRADGNVSLSATISHYYTDQPMGFTYSGGYQSRSCYLDYLVSTMKTTAGYFAESFNIL